MPKGEAPHFQHPCWLYQCSGTQCNFLLSIFTQSLQSVILVCIWKLINCFFTHKLLSSHPYRNEVMQNSEWIYSKIVSSHQIFPLFFALNWKYLLDNVKMIAYFYLIFNIFFLNFKQSISIVKQVIRDVMCIISRFKNPFNDYKKTLCLWWCC